MVLQRIAEETEFDMVARDGGDVKREKTGGWRERMKDEG